MHESRELEHATFLSHERTVFLFYLSSHYHIYILSLFALVEMITLKIWERPMSWPSKCSLPVAVRGSKTLHSQGPDYMVSFSPGLKFRSAHPAEILL